MDEATLSKGLDIIDDALASVLAEDVGQVA